MPSMAAFPGHSMTADESLIEQALAKLSHALFYLTSRNPLCDNRSDQMPICPKPSGSKAHICFQQKACGLSAYFHKPSLGPGAESLKSLVSCRLIAAKYLNPDLRSVGQGFHLQEKLPASPEPGGTRCSGPALRNELMLPSSA